MIISNSNIIMGIIVSNSIMIQNSAYYILTIISSSNSNITISISNSSITIISISINSIIRIILMMTTIIIIILTIAPRSDPLFWASLNRGLSEQD